MERIGATSLKPAVNGPSQAQGKDELREVARQFEALFVKQLMSEIKVGAGLGGEDNAQSDFVNSMWSDQLSKQVVAGGGLGLGDLLARQLGGQGGPAQDGRFKPSGPLSFSNTRRSDLHALYTTPVESFESREDFVQALKPHLEQAARELGVSPRVLAAQAALETGWGQHLPAGERGHSSNNLFGIKADTAWQGAAGRNRTQEYVDGEFRGETASFRSYASFAQSVRDYVDFLKTNPRYQQALDHGGSDENFVRGLKSAGYATDPQYVDKVLGLSRGPTLTRTWNDV